MMATNNHGSRRNARVRLVVLHTTEGARDVVSLGRFFQTGTTKASYHAAFDDNRMETYVDYSRASWSILSGNPISDNAAFCGFAAWTRAEWLKHPVMLELGAQWVAQRCQVRGVPVRRLSIAETSAAVRDTRHPGGVIMHRDYTLATKDGNHTDCGDGFPWDVVLSRAQQIVKPRKGENMITNYRVHGQDNLRLICPVGSASAVTARAWVSATVDGPKGGGHIDVWFQNEKAGVGDVHWDIAFTNGRSDRRVAEVPDGTTQINIEHNLPGEGTVCLETLSK